LYPGNPIQETPQAFTGVGTTNAAAALNSFEATVGGTANATPAPQTGGYRTINWDGVLTNGTDFGGPPNTLQINSNLTNGTIIIPRNRFVSQGVYFSDPYAVSGDGFTDVNSSVAGLFQAFSPPNSFAAANGNTIDLSFNLPASSMSTPVPAATRGFGAMFLNNELQGSSSSPGSSIEYFSGDRSLGTYYVPVGTQGQAEFLGELFPDAVVTRVTLTLGTDVLFSFDGASAKPGPNSNNPEAGHNLVVNDDFSYAEPVPLNSDPAIISGPQGIQNAQTVITAAVGAPVSAIVATFSDTDTTAGPQAYSATINWGDGHISNGLVTANSRGGFSVSGTNTYASAALFPLSVDVDKFDAVGTSITLTNTAQVLAADTTTTLTASATATQFSQPITLKAVVSPVPGAVPAGFVLFEDGSNVIGTGSVDSTGTASFTTARLPAGTHNFTAVFTGNPSFNSSTSSAVSVTISPNITPQFQFITTKLKKGGGRFTYTESVILKNTSGNTIAGPVFFVLSGLSSRVKLVNQTGFTNLLPPTPYFTIPLGPANTIVPGQALILNLTFSTASPRKIAFANLLEGGISQP
jgi:hypothetical protein